MAREKVGDELLRVRFPNGTLDRIDLISGNRSDFVRSAVAAALGGDVSDTIPVEKAARAVPSGKVAAKPEPAVKKNSLPSSAPKKGPIAPGREADKEAVLSFAREHRATAREVSAAMGWLGIRYQNAERALLSEGRIAFADSVMIVLED